MILRSHTLPTHRSLRLVGITALVACALIAAHAGYLAFTVRHVPVGMNPARAEDYRLYTTDASDGSVLFGRQHLIQSHSPTRPLYSLTMRSPSNLWLAPVPHSDPIPAEQLQRGLFYFAPRGDIYGRESGTVSTLGYGWPLVALAVDYVDNYPMPFTLVHGIPIAYGKAISEQYPRAFPTRIVWPGLLTNLTLYTVALCLMLRMVGYLHLVLIKRPIERGRVRRGLCVKCRHELAGLAICPECGTAQPLKGPKVKGSKAAPASGATA